MRIIVSGLIGQEAVTFRSLRSKPRLGGSACYAAIGASIFSRVSLISVCQSKFQGDLALLADLGIDCDLVHFVDEPGFAYHLSYTDEDSLPSCEASWGLLPLTDFLGTGLPPGIQHLPLLLAADDPCRQLLLAEKQSKGLVGLCINSNFIDEFRGEYESAIAIADLIFLTSLEFKMLNLDLVRFNGMFFVTNGGRGINVLHRGESRTFEITPAPLVCDPTGCGDVFAGAVFAQMCVGDPSRMNLGLIVESASRLATLNLISSGPLGLAERFRSGVQD